MEVLSFVLSNKQINKMLFSYYYVKELKSYFTIRWMFPLSLFLSLSLSLSHSLVWGEQLRNVEKNKKIHLID